MKSSSILTIITLSLIVALALTSAISISIVIQQGRELERIGAEVTAAEKADEVKKELIDAIKNADPADLVDASPRADEVTGTRDAIIQDLPGDVRARIRGILSQRTGR